MLSDTPKLIIPEGLKGPAIRGALKALEAITLKTKFNTFVIVGKVEQRRACFTF